MSKPSQATKGIKAKLSPEELAKRLEARKAALEARKLWTPEQREAWKRQQFSTVGTRRINTAVNVIRLLRNLSNKGSYSASDEQIASMLSHLREAVQQVELAFKKTASSKPSITL